MADQQAESSMQQEDRLDKFFADSTLEFDLRAWKYLLLRHPYLPRSLVEVDRAIAKERIKHAH